MRPAAVVNAVQAVQCGHNPDPWDPRPVLQGITVYYAHLRWAGISFALLEDRKFKNNNRFGRQADGEPFHEPAPAARAAAGGVPARLGRPRPGTAARRPVPDAVGRGDHHAAGRAVHRLRQQRRGPRGPAPGRRAGQGRRRDPPVRGHPRRLAGPARHRHLHRRAAAVHRAGGRVAVAALVHPGSPAAQRRPDAGHRGLDRRLGEPDAGARDGQSPRSGTPSTGGPTRTATTWPTARSSARGTASSGCEPDRQRYLLECWDWRADPRAGPGGQFPGWPYELPFSQV